MTREGPFEGARDLLRQCRHGALATLEPEGGPLATLVACATDAVGHPLLLLSDLARHTANLQRDGRASLLLDGGEGRAERLAQGRLTLTGTVAAVAEDDLETVRRRYLARHPDAARLLGLGDFRFYRLEVAAGHLVAGFGRIATLEAEDILVPAGLAGEFARQEPGALAHMAADHADAIDLLAGAEGARLLALDADGVDLVAGDRPVRRDFARRLTSADGLRRALVQLVHKARNS